jgi:hypothetical protein
VDLDIHGYRTVGTRSANSGHICFSHIAATSSRSHWMLAALRGAAGRPEVVLDEDNRADEVWASLKRPSKSKIYHRFSRLSVSRWLAPSSAPPVPGSTGAASRDMLGQPSIPVPQESSGLQGRPGPQGTPGPQGRSLLQHCTPKLESMTSEENKLLPTFSIFNNCDKNRDGLLSRSEFTNAMQMFMYAEKESELFDELSVEDIDDEWERAGGRSESDDVMLSPQMFDAWVVLFRSDYLEDRRSLRYPPAARHDGIVSATCAKRRLLTHFVARLLASPQTARRAAGEATRSGSHAPGRRVGGGYGRGGHCRHAQLQISR